MPHRYIFCNSHNRLWVACKKDTTIDPGNCYVERLTIEECEAKKKSG